MPSATYFQADDTLSYIRKVYTWLLVGVLVAGAAGYVALNFGTKTEIEIDKVKVAVPPIAAAMSNHGLFFGLLLIGLAFLAGVVRKVPGLNLLAFFGITGLSGAFCAPAIILAEANARNGHTLSAHPTRDAFALTTVAFTALTAYVFISKRDFSAMGSFLWTGLWVIIGASVIGIFLQSRPFDLAVSSVAVLLFVGFILFDTHRVLSSSDKDDAIGDALSLYLDILNMFVHLLRIFGTRTKD